MVGDLVRNIGGDRVRVQQLMDAGVDPHLYIPSPADASKLRGADLVFYSGLHLEGKMADDLSKIGKNSVAVADQMNRAKLLQGETSSLQFDPHIWFDVELWSQAIPVVRDKLIEFDPDHKDEYIERAEKYQDELAALHKEVKEKVASIPKEQRIMVTAHDAFRYFGRAYDMVVRGLLGISTAVETSLAERSALAKFITDRKIRAIFVETSVNPRSVRAIIQDCKALNHTVEIGGQLYSDAMGQADSAADTYVGMVRHNVDTIVKALK